MLTRVRERVRDLATRLALPQRCLFCAAPSPQDGICAYCREDLPGRSAERCPICADLSPGASRCGRCLVEPPTFSRVITAMSYRFPADAAIRRLKYGGQVALARPLGALLAERVGTEPMPDLIVPMPLSPQRLRARGFNQALELARVVSSSLGTAIDARRCVRIRDSVPQALLPWSERRRNVRGAFEWHGQLAGRVAIIDDVLTTGATLDELAKTLKRAGAAEVCGWTVARTEKP